MPVPANKGYIRKAMRRMMGFMEARGISNSDSLIRAGKRFAAYGNEDHIVTGEKKIQEGKREYTIAYVSKAKGGRIFEADVSPLSPMTGRPQAPSVDFIVFIAKADYILPGYHRLHSMGKSGKDMYGCIEQFKVVYSQFGIPAIKGELELLISKH